MKINVARHAKSNLSRSPRKSFQVIFLSLLFSGRTFSSSFPPLFPVALFRIFSLPLHSLLCPFHFFFCFFLMLSGGILGYFKLYRWFRGDWQQPNSQHESMRTRRYPIGSGLRTLYNFIARCGGEKVSIETSFLFCHFSRNEASEFPSRNSCSGSFGKRGHSVSDFS